MDEDSKHVHPMIFRCAAPGCKAEHRPKSGSWEEQSAEIGALGWKHVHGPNHGYQLRCGPCVQAVLQ